MELHLLWPRALLVHVSDTSVDVDDGFGEDTEPDVARRA